MAGLPQFMPEGQPGSSANFLMAGENAASNWMTQAANRQRTQAETEMTQQQTQQNMQQFQTMLPAIAAKANADVATSNNAVAIAMAQQQARTAAATMAPAANAEFLSIMGLSPDPTDNQAVPDDPVDAHTYRVNALSALQAKYSGLEMLPEQAGLYNAIESAKKNEFDMAGKMLTAQTELTARQYMADSLTNRAQIAAENANLRTQYQGQTARDVANTRGAATTQTAGIRAGAVTGAADIRSSASMAFQYDRMADQPGIDPNEAQQYRTYAASLRQKVLSGSGVQGQGEPTVNGGFNVPNAAPFSGGGTSQAGTKPSTPTAKGATEQPESPGNIPTLQPNDVAGYARLKPGAYYKVPGYPNVFQKPENQSQEPQAPAAEG
jgi:hypothetical protein